MCLVEIVLFGNLLVLNCCENAANSLLDKALTKLLTREYMRVQEVSYRLQQELSQFERYYKLSSQQFYIQYTDGQMGDAIDFIEWAASIEMLENLSKSTNI